MMLISRLMVLILGKWFDHHRLIYTFEESSGWIYCDGLVRSKV
jgi:hypothetical protein